MVPLSYSSWSYHAVWSPPTLRLWIASTRMQSWEQRHCTLSRTKLKKGLVSPTFVFWGSLRTFIWFVCWRDDMRKALQRQRHWTLTAQALNPEDTIFNVPTVQFHIWISDSPSHRNNTMAVNWSLWILHSLLCSNDQNNFFFQMNNPRFIDTPSEINFSSIVKLFWELSRKAMYSS